MSGQGLTDSGARGLCSRSRRQPGVSAEGITVEMSAPVPASAPPAGSPPRGGGWARGRFTLVNGVLAGVGGVYATTHSVLITIIAGVMTIALAAMMLIFQR